MLNLHAESSTDTENEESKEPSEESKEPQKKKKAATEDITVLPDAYVPLVKGQTFEFVQYEGKK